ncbi:MAG: 6-bladed beta-propeller [Prevotellaceae bacterium]|jgi:hypothetical protein|nr:6-bladed beta-propeller [Prevotellaceae bacterium]
MTKYCLTYIIVILLFVLANSCDNNKTGKTSAEYDMIKVDINQTGILDYNDYFASVNLTPLETNEESLIAQIDKLYITDKYIIIFDQKAMNILLFEINGRFLNKIGSKGNGPDEYAFFNDIQFNKKDSMIYAHERFRNCIYTYDLSGKLIKKSSRSKISFNSFYKTDEGYWVYSCFESGNPEKHNLMLLDEDLERVKKAFFPQESFINTTFSSTFITDEKEKVFFIYPSSNIIYELLREDALPFAQIDFGNKTMPYKQITQLKNMDEYDKLIADKKYLGNISNYKINQNYFFFSFSETGFNVTVPMYNCFYNFSTKEVNIYKNPFIASMNYPVSSYLLYASDDVLIYPIYPMILSDDSFDILSKTLSADIQYDSNPILAMSKLKNKREQITEIHEKCH